MKMTDVNDENVQSVSPPKTAPKISDDAIIKKSLEAVEKGVSSDVEAGVNYYTITNLPSRNRLYPEGTTILGRPLKVLDIKKLSSLNESNADFVINDILKRTIRGIALDDLYIADKLYLILWLRANSFRDSSYVVNFHCDKCDIDSTYHFEVENIDVQYLSNEYDPNKLLTLSNSKKIGLKFLTVGDNVKIERFKEMNKNALSEFDPELLTIAEMITSINGEKKTLLEKYEYVLKLEPQDFSYIVSYVDKYGMGIKPILNVKCNKCGGVGQVPVTFQPDFFLPAYKFE